MQESRVGLHFCHKVVKIHIPNRSIYKFQQNSGSITISTLLQCVVNKLMINFIQVAMIASIIDVKHLYTIYLHKIMTLN